MKKSFLIFAFLISLFYKSSGQYSDIKAEIFSARINTPIVMNVQKSGDKIIFEAINKSFFPYNFEIQFNNFQNMSPQIHNYKTTLHNGRNKLFAFTIRDKTRAPEYEFSIKYNIGNSKKVDLSYPYLIPTGANEVVNLQSIENDNKQITFVNQFKMQQNDTIFCIRKGRVTALPNTKIEVERIIKYSSLEILHDDGSVAIYFGLNPNKELLYLGQLVYPSQPIGIIGDNCILLLQLVEIQQDGKLKYFDAYYSDQNENIISSKAINNLKVCYPESIIKKEMTKKELKKYEQGNLF